MGAAVTRTLARRNGAHSATRAVLRAIGRALPLMASGRLLGRLALWTAGTFIAWIVIGVFAFDPATSALERLAGSESTGMHILTGLFVLLTLIAAAIVSALVVVAVFAMPAIVEQVAQRYHPHLQRRHGGRWHGSVRNVVITVLLFLPLWLATLLLLGLPPLYVAASWLLNGWLNQRLFRYDALSEFADHEEIVALPREIRWRLLALGVVFAPFTLVPIVNLVVPLLSGIAFACMCLDALAHRRDAIARS